MLGWYLVTVVGFSFGFDQHRRVLLSGEPRTESRQFQALFDICAWISGIACLATVVGGFFVGEWWWVFAAMAIGFFVNLAARISVPLVYSALGTLVGLIMGISGAVRVFL
ncbi:MAG: hypothetical protein O3A84_01990 [Proteobacteria bacterium]|nr:hypothetical protein [Pseudomonadota bacterium]